VNDFISFLEDSGKAPGASRLQWRGHAYLASDVGNGSVIADGLLLIGDAAGLAYPESGEGIRPAVESALLAAAAIRGCRGIYSEKNLSGYARAVEARYGARRQASAAVAPPGALKRFAASLLLRTRWFTREVVTRRWFLHEHVTPLRAV